MPNYPGGMGGGEGADLPGTLLQALQIRKAMERMAFEPEAGLLQYEAALPGFEGLPEDERARVEQQYLRYHQVPPERAGKVKQKYLADLSAKAVGELGKLEEQFMADQERALAQLEKQGATPGLDPRAQYMDVAAMLARRRQRGLSAFARTYAPILRDPTVAKEFEGMQALFGPAGTEMSMTGLMMRALGMGEKLPFEIPMAETPAQGRQEEAIGRGIVGHTQRNLPLWQALSKLGGR